MRLVPLLIVLCCCWAGSLWAQQQESKLEQRILKPDTTRAYDLRQSNFGGRSFESAGTVASKDFYSDRKFGPKEYRTAQFGSAKGSWFEHLKFWTNKNEAKGKYQIPNATKQAESKSMRVEEAREGSKTALTRELADGRRPYLGKESEKLHTTLEPNNLPRSSNELKELKTIDDVRELLNKSK